MDSYTVQLERHSHHQHWHSRGGWEISKPNHGLIYSTAGKVATTSTDQHWQPCWGWEISEPNHGLKRMNTLLMSYELHRLWKAEGRTSKLSEESLSPSLDLVCLWGGSIWWAGRSWRPRTQIGALWRPHGGPGSPDGAAGAQSPAAGASTYLYGEKMDSPMSFKIWHPMVLVVFRFGLFQYFMDVRKDIQNVCSYQFKKKI